MVEGKSTLRNFRCLLCVDVVATINIVNNSKSNHYVYHIHFD